MNVTHLGDGDVGGESVHRLKVAISEASFGPEDFTLLLDIRFVLPEKRVEIEREVLPVQALESAG